MVQGRTSRERAAAIQARWQILFKEASAGRAPVSTAATPKPAATQALGTTPQTYFEAMLRAARQGK
jgi:hypothetical protein